MLTIELKYCIVCLILVGTTALVLNERYSMYSVLFGNVLILGTMLALLSIGGVI